MNVPRTAAQQVPPAAMGVGGTLPPRLPHQRVQGLVLRAPDWWSQPHKLPAPSVGTCVSPPHNRPPRHAECCLQSPSRTRLATRALRRLLSMRVFPLLSLSVSLIFLPITDIVLVCAHTHSYRLIKSAVCCRHCNACPHCHCHTTSGHFVPLRPCWKLEQGICVL